MLKLIELIVRQPKDYSEMLTKIAVFTLFSSLSATALLDHFSPAASALLNTWNVAVNFWIIEEVPIVWMIVPVVFTLLARVVKLHDRISDVFKIREGFDLDKLLMPLAKGVGIDSTPALRDLLKANRDAEMSRNFYNYAGFEDPVIDKQLVLSALDNWCWYWVILELVTVGLLTSVILVFPAPRVALIVAAGMALMLLLSHFLVRQVRRLAVDQVTAILDSDERRTRIRENFDALQGQGTDDQV